jgi:hypothetical protein
VRTGCRALGVGVLLAWACLLLALPVPAAAEDVATDAAQELTLDGIGTGAQAVYAAHGVIEVSFPPPATQVAPTGTFVRVFFSHSQDLAAGSTMLLAVNGQPLVTVPLTAGTAAGGVLEERLPISLIGQRQPNHLQVTFDLRPAPGGAPLYGRIDGPTLVHYELTGPGGGAPGLEAYPYSLLAAGTSSPALGVVLPPAPDAREAGAALRLLADLGRRAASQQVRPRVVTGDQQAWLAAGGTGALLVGRVNGLPTAGQVLGAAGWKKTGAGWTAPDGRALKPDEGLVLKAVSPWNHRTPLVLVTGGTDAAVTKAAAALVGSGAPLAGDYAVVADAGAGAGSAPSPDRSLTLNLLGPRDPAAIGPGRYRATISFPAPAVDPDDTVVLDVDVPAFATAVPSSSVEADVNGTRVAAAGLEGGGVRSSQLRTSFSGRLLRPGGNALSVDYRIASPAPAAARAAPADGPVTVEGTDALNATLSLPLTEPTVADLRLLPYPFLEGGQQAQVVLADGSAGTLTAAAQEMVALGSRSTQPPPELPTFFASGWNASGDDNLLVVGRPPAESSLGGMAAQLPVVFGRGGQVTMSSGRSAGGLRLTSSVGAVQEMKTPDAAAREVLWLDATGPEMLSGAAAAIYDTRLGGAVAVVDQAGRVSSLRAEDVLPAVTGPATAQVVAVAAGVLVVAVLALQLVRPRRSPLTAGSRG